MSPLRLWPWCMVFPRRTNEHICSLKNLNAKYVMSLPTFELGHSLLKIILRHLPKFRNVNFVVAEALLLNAYA